MATIILQSLGVAAEAAFGSIVAGTGTVPVSGNGMSYAMLEFDRASFYDNQATEVNERDEGRMAAYALPAEPVTMFASGTRIQRRTGEISVTMSWRTIGAASAYANYAASPMGRLLDSCLGGHTPLASTDTVASGVNTTNFNASAGGKYTEGELIAAPIAGRREYSAVTDVETADITHSPAFSAGLSDEAVRLCETYTAPNVPSAVGASVGLRFDGDGLRFYAYGCRVSTIRWYHVNGKVLADLTIRCAIIQDDDSNASLADPTRMDGEVAHSIGSYMVYAPTSTTGIGTTTFVGGVAGLTRATMDVSDWEVTYAVTLAKQGSTETVIGYADLEVTDWSATGSMTMTADANFANLRRDQIQKSILLGWSPTLAGNGGCLYFPAANITSDSLPSEGEDSRQVRVITFSAGQWTLDDATAAPADTNFRVGCPL